MSDTTGPGGPGREKRNLGRGLAALFGEEKADYAELDRARSSRKLNVGQLRPGRFQPRRRFNEEDLSALVASIREKGVLQPLLVRRLAGEAEQFEIIAGERRWRAAQIAQVHEVPVVVRDMSDAEALEIALIENIQRESLTPLEEAEGYQRLMNEFSHTQEDLSRAVGKSRSHVANMLRLLNLPEGVKTLLDDGALSMGHARALLNAKDAELIAREVVDKGLSVRETEKLAASAKARPAHTPKSSTGKIKAAIKDADTLALERDLSMLLGLKVAISLKGEKGEVAIQFETLEQLDDVLNRLKRDPARSHND
jgi:ParB family chromosome partitioning protein